MLQRVASRLVRSRLRAMPAVAVVGPRQAGKTTLARSLGGNYFDLERESDRLRLDLEWPALVTARKLVILDEAQSWPEVFPRLRAAIDERRSRKGRFLLLGSVSPALMTQVSESLAGRLAVVELTPLLHGELRSAASRGRLWLCGGFPDGGVLSQRRFPTWQRDYLTLLAQRDLPAWGMAGSPQQTERFMRMLAALHGQVWNASDLARSLGVSYHTANARLDYLQGAFLVRRLAPFSTNLPKRLVKSPRVYWRDSGLLHALLGAPDQRRLLEQPWVGASWEGFVIEQAIGLLTQIGVQVEPFWFRTADGLELDLVLDFGGERWAVEIKLTSNPSTGELRRLEAAADLIGARRRFLVSHTTETLGTGATVSCDLAGFLERLAAV